MTHHAEIREKLKAKIVRDSGSQFGPRLPDVVELVGLLEAENAALRSRLESIERETVEKCALEIENYKHDQPETLGNMGYKFKLAAKVRALSPQHTGTKKAASIS